MKHESLLHAEKVMRVHLQRERDCQAVKTSIKGRVCGENTEKTVSIH